MTLISNLRIFFIFQISIFKFFFTNITDFLHFHMIHAALLLIIYFFLKKINCFHWVLSKRFTKRFPTIFTSLYIMLISYASRWRYSRHWKAWWNIFTYFCCSWISLIIFTFINLFYYTFKICVINKWCFVRFLILINF